MKVLLVGLGKMGYTGFGNNHIWTHWQALQGRGWEIDVCDHDEQRRLKFASKELSTRVWPKLSVALENKFDAVVIATPPETHLGIIGECANAGVKKVLCEKPLAHTVEDAIAIVDSCRVWGLKLVVGHQRRYDARHNTFKAYFDKNDIVVERAMVIFPLFDDNIMNNGSHAADIALFYEAKEIALVGIPGKVFQVTLETSDRATHIHEDYGQSNINQLLEMYEDLLGDESALSNGNTALAAMRKVEELCGTNKSIQATG